MASTLGPQPTSFTQDNMGRFLCNTLQEALYSTGTDVGLGPPPPDGRPFDVIVIGGGAFGVVFAQHLLAQDDTQSRRILVLERGPFVVPEHQQNLPYVGGVLPPTSEIWVSDLASLANNRKGGFAGLLFTIGGRSLHWGGWSPEPLDDEMADWPVAVRTALKGGYFEQASDELGATDTNDFVYGPLHAALREQLYSSLKAGIPDALPFTSWPDHPKVRFKLPNATDAQLRDLLGLDPSDTTPRQQLLDLLKLEAPLAVQSRTEPGLFPVNKFSSVPLLIRSVRKDVGASAGYDQLRRIMAVPYTHVQEIRTQTLADNTVQVTGVAVVNVLPSITTGAPGGTSNQMLVPLASGGVVLLALGTIENSRLALLTFQQSLAGRAFDRMGQNLMAHLRSNVTIRVPLANLDPNLGNLLASAKVVPVSALFVKGSATIAGQNRYFHVQISASGGKAMDSDAEADLFQKVPDLETLDQVTQASPTHAIIVLRGVGEMQPDNASSRVQLAQFDQDLGRQAAWVTMGDAKAFAENQAHPPQPGSPGAGNQTTPITDQTRRDAQLWDAMDGFLDELMVVLANSQTFQILTAGGAVSVPAGTPASAIRGLYPYEDNSATNYRGRRDGLGSTHHEAGTMRMGDDPSNSVTDMFGRIHDTPNCYCAGPSLVPRTGSPNPMLTSVALSRRTADYLAGKLLPAQPGAPPLPRPTPFGGDGPGWQVLFDGTFASFKNWQRIGSANGANNQPPCNFLYADGQIVTVGAGDFALLVYRPEAFSDFILKLQFRIFEAVPNPASFVAMSNSGVFVRFRDPLVDPTPAILTRMKNTVNDYALFLSNRVWSAVFTGFEVQIDDSAQGDSRIPYHTLPQEPAGLMKNRTGAIYKIPAGDAIPNSNQRESQDQVYQPGLALVPRAWMDPTGWYEYEIRVTGNDYEVRLGLAGAPKTRTSAFTNTDQLRGLPASLDPSSGYIGLQAYSQYRVAFRNIQIKKQ
jgi:choline dehydrogenase-like flavoprotein